MNLPRILRGLSPASVVTGLRMLRAVPEARRLLNSGAPPPTRSCSPIPYDWLEMARLRFWARRIACLAGKRTAVAAAAVVATELGWPCELIVTGTDAELRLWGARVCGTQPAALQEGRCVHSAGMPLPMASPRLPRVTDPRIAQQECRGGLDTAVRELLTQVGSVAAFVKPGDSVLLKPNVNSYHPPPASTALDLLEVIVTLLREAGANRIAVGECSTMMLGRTRPTLERAGVLRWARDAGVEVIAFDEEPWQACPISGRHFSQVVLPEAVQQFDRLIYLACAKTHREAGVSLAEKLAVGLMHPAQRLELHGDHLAERIADIKLAAQPDLAILDARRCFIAGGPCEGEVREPGMLLASADIAALDAAGVALLAEHGACGGSLRVQCDGQERKRLDSRPTIRV